MAKLMQPKIAVNGTTIVIDVDPAAQGYQLGIKNSAGKFAWPIQNIAVATGSQIIIPLSSLKRDDRVELIPDAYEIVVQAMSVHSSLCSDPAIGNLHLDGADIARIEVAELHKQLQNLASGTASKQAVIDLGQRIDKLSADIASKASSTAVDEIKDDILDEITVLKAELDKLNKKLAASTHLPAPAPQPGPTPEPASEKPERSHQTETVVGMCVSAIVICVCFCVWMFMGGCSHKDNSATTPVASTGAPQANVEQMATQIAEAKREVLMARYDATNYHKTEMEKLRRELMPAVTRTSLPPAPIELISHGETKLRAGAIFAPSMFNNNVSSNGNVVIAVGSSNVGNAIYNYYPTQYCTVTVTQAPPPVPTPTVPPTKVCEPQVQNEPAWTPPIVEGPLTPPASSPSYENAYNDYGPYSYYSSGYPNTVNLYVQPRSVFGFTKTRTGGNGYHKAECAPYSYGTHGGNSQSGYRQGYSQSGSNRGGGYKK
jgi:hypothetical protein